MAALKETWSYGLSCGRLGDGSRVSVFHVKLTDSAVKAFESYRSSQGSVTPRPSIRFQGNQGVSPKHMGHSRGDVHLDCLGSIQDKITVCATDDSYQKARQSLAQAEEETRSRSAIVIKPGGRYLGKRVHFRKPAPGPPDPVPSRKRATPANPASTLRKCSGGGVSQRPFRDRVLHLLALRPYRKAELLLRLQRDGLSQPDKDSLDSLLQQVANVSTKDGTCTLKDSMYKDVQRDWPGYSEGDRQLLQRMLVRKLCQPQGAGPVPGDPAASPPREHGNASSLPQKRPQPPDFIDPLASKKPRISHFAQRTQPAINGKLNPPLNRAAPNPPMPEPLRPHDPLADVSNDLSHTEPPEAGGPGPAERLHPPPSPDCTQPSRPHGKAKKKSKKHRDKERLPRDRPRGSKPNLEPVESSGSTVGTPPDAPGLNGACHSASIPTSTSDTPDYLLKYSAISSSEQRQSYKNDFNSEYSEYRDLHARIERITRRFTQLDAQLRQLSQGSPEYETTRGQILQEYRKIKKTNTHYSQEKQRCEYLHSKLAHIKRLIAEYDQRQAPSWH
ncbi:RNA polymerase II elongation factor ELL [Echinops telfairi]|uniref:RNA polymerase II elongation factor ELL n=1 Tax=Echinops telfairi TaxID=9371 RepID=A0ABM0IQP6_ECHTE|nr:RNA polymerase II elongation factor ELL [Echinops telfairi]